MNRQFRHYKGAIYTVIGIGNHTESDERLVAYYDWQGIVFFRPAEMFFGKVEIDGEKVDRFSPVE